MTVTLWSWMQPLLRKVVSKITVESFGDWGTCFATGKENALKNRTSLRFFTGCLWDFSFILYIELIFT